MAKNFYVISYQGSKAAEVKAAIKTLGAWFNHFDNQFLLSTPLPLSDVRSLLDSIVVPKHDRILIMEVTVHTTNGWLTQDGWDWLNAEIRKHDSPLY